MMPAKCTPHQNVGTRSYSIVVLSRALVGSNVMCVLYVYLGTATNYLLSLSKLLRPKIVSRKATYGLGSV